MSTEPFSDSSTATSDASGNIVFTNFQNPPTRISYWRQGTFSVVRSDGGVVVSTSVLPITWKAFVGPTIWGTWYNDQPSNMVQTNGPPVKVTGVNLAASTAYQCVFTGFDSDIPPPLSPLPARPSRTPLPIGELSIRRLRPFSWSSAPQTCERSRFCRTRLSSSPPRPI